MLPWVLVDAARGLDVFGSTLGLADDRHEAQPWHFKPDLDYVGVGCTLEGTKKPP